jgi:hypothetical protein
MTVLTALHDSIGGDKVVYHFRKHFDDGMSNVKRKYMGRLQGNGFAQEVPPLFPRKQGSPPVTIRKIRCRSAEYECAKAPNKPEWTTIPGSRHNGWFGTLRGEVLVRITVPLQH